MQGLGRSLYHRGDGMKYTQREWDRVVGYGKVPEEYRHVSIEKQMDKIVREAKRIERNHTNF